VRILGVGGAPPLPCGSLGCWKRAFETRGPATKLWGGVQLAVIGFNTGEKCSQPGGGDDAQHGHGHKQKRGEIKHIEIHHSWKMRSRGCG